MIKHHPLNITQLPPRALLMTDVASVASADGVVPARDTPPGDPSPRGSHEHIAHLGLLLLFYREKGRRGGEKSGYDPHCFRDAFYPTREGQEAPRSLAHMWGDRPRKRSGWENTFRIEAPRDCPFASVGEHAWRTIARKAERGTPGYL